MSDTVAETAEAADSEVTRWVTEIKLYEKEAKQWTDRAKKVVKRYKDERTLKDSEGAAKFNILWSNVQTLLPAVYAQNPKPDIERRFKDADDLGRVASTILERSASYFMDEYPFGETMRQAVLDRLLGGRGVIWMRYEPHFRDVALQGKPEEISGEGQQVTDDAESEMSYQEVDYEKVCFDYVHWEDFGHNVARTWEEVYAVWRKVYLDRKELVERFGKEVGNAIQLDYTPKNLKDEKVSEYFKKATIYEIWDKRTKKAIWLHKDYISGLLDKSEDPLKLKNFFPTPQPLYATLANDSLMPVPDFVEYQDQAAELDQLTGRIFAITKALKVAGVYASDAEGLERILSEGTENKLVPIEQWQLFAEKGGMRGVFELLPVQEIANTLLSLYDARERVKNDLYEITGIADIVRGASKATETATAQQIKGQFATMRLDSMRDGVARFARDLVAIMVEIIANHFQIETIKEISGVRLMSAQEKQAMQQKLQMASQSGQQPQIPDELQEALENPTWEEVEQLFRSDAALHFRINIETDSTIKADEEAEKAARIEFLGAVGQFMQTAQTVQIPELVPLLGQLLLFGVRGFRVGKEVESAFEIAIGKMERRANSPQQEKPDPEMEKLKAETQLKQQEMQATMQMKQAEMQSNAAIKEKELQSNIQLKQVEIQANAEIEKYKADLNAQTALETSAVQAKTSIKTARIAGKAKQQQDLFDNEGDDELIAEPEEKQPTTSDLINTIQEGNRQLAEAVLTGMRQGLQEQGQMIAEALNRPKQVMRGQDGKIAAVH